MSELIVTLVSHDAEVHFSTVKFLEEKFKVQTYKKKYETTAENTLIMHYKSKNAEVKKALLCSKCVMLKKCTLRTCAHPNYYPKTMLVQRKTRSQ